MTPTTSTYGALQGAVNVFNKSIFDDELPELIVTLQRRRGSLGYFSPGSWVNPETGELVDELAVNPAYFVNRTIEDILSTVVHEMVHQWQYHFGKVKSQKAYHNKEFAIKMESVGLMTSSNGRPGGKRVGSKMSHYIIPDSPFTEVCKFLIGDKGWKLNYGYRFTEQGVFEKLKTVEIEGVESTKSGFEPGMIKERPPTTKNKNKVKYECLCENKVWGKADLRITCMDCGTRYKEVVKEEVIHKEKGSEEKELS